MDAAALKAWMVRDPARSHLSEPSIECTIKFAVSQLLAAPSWDIAHPIDYVLGDLSSGQSRALSPSRSL